MNVGFGETPAVLRIPLIERDALAPAPEAHLASSRADPIRRVLHTLSWPGFSSRALPVLWSPAAESTWAVGAAGEPARPHA